MSKNKKGNYDKEFKSMIVKLYEEGTSVAQLFTDYELNQSSVYKWIDNISSTGTEAMQLKIPNLLQMKT